MSNPTGTWQINANRFRGDLVISSVDAQGNLNGTVLGDPIVGFWDEGSQKITFARSLNSADPFALQVFTGFHFDANQPLFPAGGGGSTTYAAVPISGTHGLVRGIRWRRRSRVQIDLWLDGEDERLERLPLVPASVMCSGPAFGSALFVTGSARIAALCAGLSQ
jgi:hypothetical protein